MILFVNESGEIQDVNTTEKSGLQTLVISDDNNPFDGWSAARICCYRVEVADERIVMFTPYIDTRIVEQLDRQGAITEATAAAVTDTQDALATAFEGFDEAAIETANDITDLQEAIVGIYEVLGG